MPPARIASSWRSAMSRAAVARSRDRGPTSGTGTSRLPGEGNLGAPPKPPHSASCCALEPRGALVAPARRGGSRLARSGARERPPAPARAGRCLDDRVALLAPRVVHARQQLQHAGPRAARGRRKVRAAEERLEVGREEQVQRPAAAHAHRLHRGHVEAVDVRPLLAVHLDAARSASLSSAATSSFSNDSRSMTWHQWQVE